VDRTVFSYGMRTTVRTRDMHFMAPMVLEHNTYTQENEKKDLKKRLAKEMPYNQEIFIILNLDLYI
jgi:hypothetical protein